MSAIEQATSGDSVFHQQSPGGSGLRRERVADIQRVRISAAAVGVIAEHGASNATVAHIVAHAGVSRRTFYELFVDREDCFLAAFDLTVGRIGSTVAKAYEGPGAWRARMRAALVALLEALEQDRDVSRFVIVEMLGGGPEALERRRRVLERIIAAVDEGQVADGRERVSPLAAEGVVGGVLGVLHARLLSKESDSLLELAGPLMSMIVLPYLGAAAAQKESSRPVPERQVSAQAGRSDPLRGLGMRLTYRTVLVLAAIAANPGASNRQVGTSAGISDQGQISKLLARLHGLDLVENVGTDGVVSGGPNAWTLTAKGSEVERAVSQQTAQ